MKSEVRILPQLIMDHEELMDAWSGWSKTNPTRTLVDFMSHFRYVEGTRDSWFVLEITDETVTN